MSIMKSILLFIIIIFCFESISAQTDTSKNFMIYQELPPSSEEFTAGTMAARTIDGLGFRYYWATEGLNENDLNFRPTEEARSSYETMLHIYDLTLVICKAVQLTPGKTLDRKASPTYTELRIETLTNLKAVSDRLGISTEADFEKYTIKLSGGKEELPFWNVLTGPIEDAIWHVGQIASFRRMSGNPISNEINFLKGTIK